MLKPTLLLAIVSLGGCVLDFDDVGPQPSGAAPSTGGAGGFGAGGDSHQGGAVVSCASEACMPIPFGFEGVVHLRVTDEAPSVPACAESQLVFEGGEGLTFEDATCNCGCGPSEPFCSLPMARARLQQGCNVSSPSALVTMLPEAGCTPLPEINNAPSQSVSLEGATELPADIMCASDQVAPTRPEPSFERYAQACAFSSEGCAEGSVCITPVDQFATCFYRETFGDKDLACPSDLRSFEVVRARDQLLDARNCTCACDTAAGPITCGTPVWQLFGEAACDEPLSDTSAGACHTHVGGIAAATVYSAVELSCGPPTQTVQGSVTVKNSMLVCCL